MVGRLFRAFSIFVVAVMFLFFVVACVVALYVQKDQSTAIGVMGFIFLPAILPVALASAISILVCDRLHPTALVCAVFFVFTLNPIAFNTQDNFYYGIAATIGALLFYWPAKFLFNGSIKKSNPSPPEAEALIRNPPPEK